MVPETEQAATEKRVFTISLVIALLIAGTAVFMQSETPELQSSFQHMYAAHEMAGGLWGAGMLLLAYLLRRSKMPLLSAWPAKVAANPFPLLLFVAVALAIAAKTVYRGLPLNVDEYSLFFQAWIFAEGHIVGHFPPALLPWLVPATHVGHFFSVSSQTGSIATAYWPGFSLLLAPFMRLGMPWLLNPLLTAGSLYLLWLLSGRLFRAPEASGWVLLFTLASPVVTVDALSYYATTSHLFFNLLYAWLLVELSPARLFLAGLVGSMALLQHNPVPHLLFALPWIFWIGGKPRRLRNLGLLFFGYLPFSILLGFGWVWVKMKIVQGAFSLAASASAVTATEAKNAVGAAAAGGISISGDLLREPFRLLREILTLPDANFVWLRFLGILKIFAWAVPGLPVLASMGGMRLKNGETGLRLWGWAAVLTLLGYLFVPVSQGHGWGFRYFHSAWAVLPLLGAFFVLQTQVLEGSGKKFVLLAVLLSLFFGNAMRFWQVGDFVSRHWAQLPQIEKGTGGKIQLVFIDPLQGFYAQDLVQNDPFLRGETIYLVSRGGAMNRRLLQSRFPGAEEIRQKGLHSVWLVDKQQWMNLLKS